MQINKENESLNVDKLDDITAANIDTLKDSLLKEMDDISEVVLDLDQVELIDSSGISLLVSIQNSLNKKAGTLKLINASDDLKHMFKLMRLDRHFAVC